jgi:hypothetical protein
MNKSIQQKFSCWVCLLCLDLAASISFRGYEVIRNVEFYGCTERKKYQRGIFAHQTRLSQLARELESHAGQMNPYEITKKTLLLSILK